VSLDRSAIEAEYVRDLVELLTSGRLPIDFQGHRVTGPYPETVLTLLFRVPDYSPCLYGVEDRIWAEDPIAAFGVERAVTYTWLRIEELVVAAGTDLATTCQPDEEGITHVDLWAG
jgi:hypothetical protein